MFGLPADAEVDYDRTFLAGIHPDDREAIDRSVRRAIDPVEGGDVDVDVRYRAIGRGDGVERWVAARGRAYFDGSATASRFIGTVRDITPEKRAADELRASAEALRLAKVEAEEASEAKSRFLAILSHELRTPLNPILLAVTAMVDRPPTPEEVRANLQMIRQNVDLQARLIDDLLDVMRIVRGKMPLRWEVADGHALIERAVEVCRGELSEKKLRLELDLAAGLHWVNTDSARLQQVFWNLIKNAVKFTPGGGTITIRTRNAAAGPSNRDEVLAIEVRDDGIGIEPEVLPRIFEPFQQGESTTTRTYGGLGLGLTICRGVVEGHGGSLVAESPGKGQGSTFRVVLPALPDPQGQDGMAPHSREGEASPLAPKSRLKILIVEDDPATRRLMSRLLANLGHEVVTAGTVATAIEALEGREPDLIVSDIGLPDGSGLDLMRRVITTRGPIPAIALTGFGMEEDIQKSQAAGFATHMTKPIDFTKLESMILKVAAGRPDSR